MANSFFRKKFLANVRRIFLWDNKVLWQTVFFLEKFLANFRRTIIFTKNFWRTFGEHFFMKSFWRNFGKQFFYEKFLANFRRTTSYSGDFTFLINSTDQSSDNIQHIFFCACATINTCCSSICHIHFESFAETIWLWSTLVEIQQMQFP